MSKIGQNLQSEPDHDEYQHGLGDLTPEEWDALIEQRRERETNSRIDRYLIDKANPEMIP